MNPTKKQIYDKQYQEIQEKHETEGRSEMNELAIAFNKTELEINAFCCKRDARNNNLISAQDLKEVESFTIKKAAQIKTLQEMEHQKILNKTDKQIRANLCQHAANFLLTECGHKRWAKGHSLPLSVKVIISKQFDGKLTVHNFRENLERN